MKIESNSQQIKWLIPFFVLIIFELFLGWIIDIAVSNFDVYILIFSIALSILWMIGSGLILKMNHRLLSKVLIANTISFYLFNVFAYLRALESMASSIFGFAFFYIIITVVVVLIKSKCESAVFKFGVLPIYYIIRGSLALLILGFYGLAL